MRETGVRRRSAGSLTAVKRVLPIFLTLALIARAESEPLSFNKNFEGGSLGRIEQVADDHFLLHAEGQQNEQGRNRQPTWYSFRIDHARGRDLTLTLTDFIGEYNSKPAVAMNAELLPVFSNDGEKWQHFTEGAWDDEKKELILHVKPEADSLYIAHIQPYPHARLLRLLEELRPRESLRIEVIGKSTLGRDLHLLTVTDWAQTDAEKGCVWLQARQHAWEAGTSYVMEGALRFITSDEPPAQALRRKFVFKFTPMVDPDGAALGKVRFNANGYDVNRHWSEVNLRDPALLRLMPEIWYTKKAILFAHAQKPVELLINLHNTETAEYMDTAVDDEKALQPFTKAFALLTERSIFDPSRVPTAGPNTVVGGNTNSLWTEARVPVALMELRIGPSKKLGRRPTAEDRLQFGKELIQAMAAACER
jgi:hypothetical protein